MALLYGREGNRCPRMDELLLGEGADEDAQPFHGNIPMSDSHLVPLKNNVLPWGIGRQTGPVRGKDALLHLDPIPIDHPENSGNRNPFHRVDVTNFEGFPLGNAGHEQDPVIMDIPDLKAGEGIEGRCDYQEKRNEKPLSQENRLSLVIG